MILSNMSDGLVVESKRNNVTFLTIALVIGG
jgi:hypothetical protein